MAKVPERKSAAGDHRLIGKIGCGICYVVFGKFERTMVIYKTPKCLTGRCQRCDSRIFIRDVEAIEFFEQIKEQELQQAYQAGVFDANKENAVLLKAVGEQAVKMVQSR